VTAHTVTLGDIELVVDEAGDGPSVVLLHGWPDTSALWRGVVPRLVDAGFRVVVPDLRGCGRSSKPEGIEAYRVEHLVADVLGVIDQRCDGRASVVGHDWGANLAWVTASFAPAAVDHLVAVSVGHPTSFRAAGLAQQVRSWYVLLFEHEGIAETWLSRDDFAVMREWLEHPDADGVVAEIIRDGTLTTHLNWYRATFTAKSFVAKPPSIPPILAPTMGIWSTRDVALCEEQMTGSAAFCQSGFTYVRMEGLGHWIPLEDPARLAEHLVGFLPGSAA